MKIFTLCILFFLMMCTPVYPQTPPQPWFGKYTIANNYVFVKITYLNGKKEKGSVLNESDNDIWIMTEKGIVGIRLKNRIDHIDVLRIKNKEK